LGEDRIHTGEGNDRSSKRKFVHRVLLGTILYDAASDNCAVAFP
jgi:hypothetical protein